MRYRGPLKWAVVVTAALTLVACSGDKVDSSGTSAESSPPAATMSMPPDAKSSDVPAPGAKVTHNMLTVQVTGSCSDKGGFRLKASGFTENGKYHTGAVDPEGNLYTYIVDGQADSNGHTPNWSWNCTDGPSGQRDMPGVYILNLTDLTTGRIVTASFEIKY